MKKLIALLPLLIGLRAMAADVKISALPAAASATAAQIVPVVDSGVTKQITVQQLLTLIQSSAFASTVVTQGNSYLVTVSNGWTFTDGAGNVVILTNGGGYFSSPIQVGGTAPSQFTTGTSNNWQYTQGASTNNGATFLNGAVTHTGSNFWSSYQSYATNQSQIQIDFSIPVQLMSTNFNFTLLSPKNADTTKKVFQTCAIYIQSTTNGLMTVTAPANCHVIPQGGIFVTNNGLTRLTVECYPGVATNIYSVPDY